MPEQRRSFGNLNADKTFFVIRFYPPATGLLAVYIYVLGIMEYAERHGWIPVIDMQNYETLYDIDRPIHGTTNVWEHYFLQPETDGIRYSLDEVYNSKNVILSSGTMDEWYLVDELFSWQLKQNRKLDFYDEVKKYILDQYAHIIPVNSRTIGIILRGRSQKRRLCGNFIQMTIEDIIPIIKERLIDWNCDAIFVKSDEQEPIEELCRLFPELKIFYTESNRSHNYKFTLKNSGDDALLGMGDNSESSLPRVYLNQIEYLADIYIVSKCTCLISSYNNGFFAARVWNEGKYEHIEIIDKGRYK